MRENMGLYRGKNVSTGEWVYGYLYIRHDGECEIGSYNKEYNIERWTTVVAPATVGQGTGLTDKNGKRIFEGDVVSGLFLYALPINGVCAFQNGAFGLEWERGEAKEFTAFTSMCNVEFEVIGNVHDNPELKGES